jgi:hypothetical protein
VLAAPPADGWAELVAPLTGGGGCVHAAAMSSAMTMRMGERRYDI